MLTGKQNLPQKLRFEYERDTFIQYPFFCCRAEDNIKQNRLAYSLQVSCCFSILWVEALAFTDNMERSTKLA